MAPEVASTVLLSNTRALGSHMARDSQALTYREERETIQLPSADIFDQNALPGGRLYFVPRFFSSGLVILRYAISGASRVPISLANVGGTGSDACSNETPEKQASSEPDWYIIGTNVLSAERVTRQKMQSLAKAGKLLSEALRNN
ncbi:uncharacterized protein FFB20_09135 [Fusarium fujikuroi]|nr:uncharacterized protein FFB20_09135 [Fusarium fujikuroi]SCO24055.1 uncharacterized protein FFE2_15860 [Fusarium fujikuroi]SCO25674.1 uncharacterized protein FFC1_15653 [Fusarium fujikuroi]SCO53897.1 uncharacterized protein FFNC_15245 [Fusarium fujikuroi]